MKKQHSRKPKAEPKAKPRRAGRGAKRHDAEKAGESAAPPPDTLRGWKAIAQFLALPVNVAQRWAKDGMPLRREGRFTVADADELRYWLGRESEMPAPAHIAVNSADLAAGLNESIAAVRKQKRDATRPQ